MMRKTFARRAFLRAAGIAALSTAGVLRTQNADAQQAVPNSSGTEQPRIKAPANAADCHIHIYDARFPPSPIATLRPQTRASRITGSFSVGSG